MKNDPHNRALTDEPISLPTPVVDAAIAARKTLGPWSVLRNRNYALLFWGQLISAAGTQMQVVAVAWQVYLLTHSAVALGIIGLIQAIPRLIFSLVGGCYALQRKRVGVDGIPFVS